MPTPAALLPLRHLALSLLLLRLGIAIVMGIWAADKFVNPGHGQAVLEHFYGMGDSGVTVVTLIGLAQVVIVTLFTVGLFRTWSYGAVLLMHGVTTLASWKQYLDAFDNLLFFAAWPMLAACITLFLLQKYDTILNADAMRTVVRPS
ncbi:hypothetical protein [Brevundimonas variabilis]|uniref:DoxX family protein n=1 Tax=Brevundimonas variabilis TaxID=74312 RepID=A0A7W9CK65_9CAUL|nr:hypothetical protein [Brevundimonas variabilis]MBB5746974.1 hypothetical protein [Brevundimonas variabilis]